MKPKLVEIEHAALGRARVVESALEVWLAREWKRVDGPAVVAEVKEDAEDASATPEDNADAAPSDVTASSDLSQNV